MPPNLGTRTKQGFKYERLAQGSTSQSYTRDLHMTKRVTASLTFSGSPPRVSGANGTFGVVTAVSGAANNGAGAVRLTVGSTAGLPTGSGASGDGAIVVTVAGVDGTTEANGTWPFAVIDGTHIDLIGSQFQHAYTSGGSAFYSVFASNDPLWIETGAVLNAGALFTITGLDGSNAAFLALDPAPQAEGPLTVTVRTP